MPKALSLVDDVGFDDMWCNSLRVLAP